MKKLVLATEGGAQRGQLPPGGTWRIENASGAVNKANGAPTAYKLVPNSRGAPQPLLLADAESAVTKRGMWATSALWVTPYAPEERFPAGEFPTQSIVDDAAQPLNGLHMWCASVSQGHSLCRHYVRDPFWRVARQPLIHCDVQCSGVCVAIRHGFDTRQQISPLLQLQVIICMNKSR